MPNQQRLIPNEHLTRSLSDLAVDYSPVEVIEACYALWPDLATHGPDSTPARLTDKQTSQDAAAKHATKDVSMFRAGSMRARVLCAFGAQYGEPMTANGIAAKVTDNFVQRETARKRVSELERAGFLASNGIVVEDGSDRTEYVLTAAGRRAIDSLQVTGWSRTKVVKA